MNEKENKTTNSTTHNALGFCVIGIIGLAFGLFGQAQWAVGYLR